MKVSEEEIRQNNELFNDFLKQGVRPFLVVYTDGCSHVTKGEKTGGWGFVVLEWRIDGRQDLDDIIYQGCGGLVNTTNNVMELTAMKEAFKVLPEHCDVILVSDSQYAIGVLNGGKVKANHELVQDCISLIGEKDIVVTWRWVKGHSTDNWNNYVDILSNLGSAETDIMNHTVY